VASETTGDTLIDHRDRIVRVQGFQVGAGNLKINNLWFIVELLVEQAGGVFNKFGEGTIHLSEGLLILTLHHDLRLSLQGFKAEFLQAFDTQVLAFGHLNADASRAALRVRDAVDITGSTGVLR
jgi:hypothetical protein